jgi:hypothetical protein
MCNKGFLSNTTNGADCVALSGTVKVNYFIQSGAPLLALDFTAGYNRFLTNNGTDPSTPYLFIQQAFNDISNIQKTRYPARIEAKILLT